MRKWLRGRLIRLVNLICPPEVTEYSGTQISPTVMEDLELAQDRLRRRMDLAARRESRGWN